MNSPAFVLTTLGVVSLAVLAGVVGILLDAAQHAAQAQQPAVLDDDDLTTTTTPTPTSEGEPRNVCEDDTIYELRLPTHSSALGLPSPAEVAAAALAEWRAQEGR